MSDWTQFTAVFDYDIRRYDSNPFHADTPFGRPTLTAVGNLAEQIEGKDERIAELEAENAELARRLGGGCDAGGMHNVMKDGHYAFCTNCGESLQGVRYCHSKRAEAERMIR